jgi:hypothetical protein
VRMKLYSDVFGLTHLRIYTVVSAAWLGIVVLLAGLAAIRPTAQEWMALASCALAAVGVFAMNVVSPDAVVASANINRVPTSRSRFDTSYLIDLSADAIPEIVARIDEVPDADRAGLIDALCRTDVRSGGWLDWNWSRAAAADALSVLCR